MTIVRSVAVLCMLAAPFPVLAACHAQSSPVTAAPSQAADVTVTRDQFGGSIEIQAGAVLAVPRPAEFDEWLVVYAPEVLEPAMPADQVRRPGAQGWRFRAVAAGRTDLVFEPILPSGGPAPPRFTLTVVVRAGR